MKLDGREIAEKLYKHLSLRVGELQKKNIVPHLVVLLVGDNPASEAYVLQKQKAGEKIAAKVTILRYEASIEMPELEEKIMLLNQDPFVHGILIQRPLPKQIDSDKLSLLTDPRKDVDGFNPESQFILPLPLAVELVLQHVYQQIQSSTHTGNAEFINWLQAQNIVLLGKGEAGGKPILAYLRKLSVEPIQIDSTTAHPEEKMKQADIIISAVGKKVINPTIIKPGVILIGVGLFKGPDDKLQGDYDEEEIKDIASFYTPTPGGIGPVNVAMLMENLITATENQMANS